MSIHDSIKKKIQQTKQIKESSKEVYDKLGLPFFVQQLELSSFDKRLDKLNQQLKEYEELSIKEELKVTMYPPDLPSGQIPVRILNAVLGGLQNLTDSIANTLFNQPSSRGFIPQDILDKHNLIIKEVGPGSFKVTLDVRHDDQTDLFDDEPSQVKTLNELFDLFNTSDEIEPLVEKISSLGPRTIKYYTEWTKLLHEYKVPVNISWRSNYRGKSQVMFEPEKANRIYSILNEIDGSDEKEIVVNGRLTGANVRTNNFELITSDGEKITGRIAKDAIPTVAKFVLDSNCKATLLQVRTFYSAHQREKTTYTLKDIELEN